MALFVWIPGITQPSDLGQPTGQQDLYGYGSLQDPLPPHNPPARNDPPHNPLPISTNNPMGASSSLPGPPHHGQRTTSRPPTSGGRYTQQRSSSRGPSMPGAGSGYVQPPSASRPSGREISQQNYSQDVLGSTGYYNPDTQPMYSSGGVNPHQSYVRARTSSQGPTSRTSSRPPVTRSHVGSTHQGPPHVHLGMTQHGAPQLHASRSGSSTGQLGSAPASRGTSRPGTSAGSASHAGPVQPPQAVTGPSRSGPSLGNFPTHSAIERPPQNELPRKLLESGAQTHSSEHISTGILLRNNTNSMCCWLYKTMQEEL